MTLTERKKRLSILLSMLLFLTCLALPASAEEVGAFEGETHRYRWAWTYVNSGGDVTKCRVKVNGDNLNSAYSSYLTSAINHWNTLDSRFGYYKDKVYCYSVAFANSKVDVYTAASNSWMYTKSEFSDIDAITLYKNSSGVWSRDPLTGTKGSFSSGTVSYSRIYCKSFSTAPAYSGKNNYIFRHEIGHVLGMGHVATGSLNSLMWPYYGNITNVCLHDIDVLEGFYPNP